ncbi:MAG: hypothetical protein ACI9N9_001121 [Enterobacterales bacterium]|jgi:hypothetical protein
MITNQTTMKRQQGVTAVGWLLILGLVGFFVLLALRLFPIYSNHYKIQTVVKSLVNEEQEGLYRISKKDLLKIFNRKLNINFAEGFKPEHLKFVIAKSGSREIHVIYEDRRPILGNLDVVAQFDDYVVVAPNGKVKIGL